MLLRRSRCFGSAETFRRCTHSHGGTPRRQLTGRYSIQVAGEEEEECRRIEHSFALETGSLCHPDWRSKEEFEQELR